MAVNDGSANASAGSPQHSDLLNSYGANRPAWNVAGVDYHVGVPQGLALKNPATISMAGVSVNTTTKIVTVTGNNVTLDGYDFSLNGGWQVSVQAANTTITNSNFLIGSNNLAPIISTAAASNMTVSYCTIDGAGKDPGWGGLISYRGNGFTVEQSWLKNAGGDMIQQIDGGANSTVVIQHNLIENGGLASGAHGDYTQLAGGPFNVAINYNTTMQNGGTTQGLMTEYVASGEIGHNTMVGNPSYFVSVDNSSIETSVTVHDNYYDPQGYGFVYPNSGPDDGSSKSIYVHNVNMKTGGVLQDANAPTTPTTPTAPAAPPNAPVISSFSNDSGVAGDKITSDNTLTLTGTATSNATVKVFDGATQIGTATANSSGAWNYTTAALADGNHNLAAKVTDASGNTSAASAALSIKVDTTAPAVPVALGDSIVNSNQVLLNGTAEANSTVKVYDGLALVGTTTAKADGTWSVTTSPLSTGAHDLTATATDVAGNTSPMSLPLDPVIGGPAPSAPIPAPTPSTPGAPKIISFSNDSGVAGDGITNDNTLNLTGTAGTNSTVKVFDGATQIGTATANSSGAWTYTTPALANGGHNLTAKATDAAGHTSAASAVLAVTIDTTAPVVPKIASNNTITDGDHVTLAGTAEAHSTVKVFDGTTQIGTATANDKGAWTYATDALKDGSHSFTAKAMDVAGNTSGSSSAFNVKIDTHAPTPSADFTKVFQNWNDTVTFKGTADPYSQINIYDNGNTKALGSVNVGSDGTWSYKTPSAVSDVAHNFTVTVTDKAGNTSKVPGSAVLGTNGDDVLTATSGNDLFKGNGGHDTFVFKSNFGADVISNFTAAGRGHDVVQFSKSVFDNFADVLSHAAQSGNDVTIDAGGGNTLTLKDTKLAALDKTDFHFA
ncbi:Ig-like domain-containing protein [Nitrobacter sp. TKz-YC02]|uniref:Ig-like domain-containing protein n=1 Tax=Nitrobacter sp. TKz-YC02 TaxID=3398704 RepID=UPI003CF56D8A